jgi:hypothetical protein
MRRRPTGASGEAGLPPAELGGYSPEQVRFAAAAWPLRAAEELRSALIFRALAQAAGATLLPRPWAERFRAMVRAEIGHARLCRAVGDRLGAERPRYDAAPVKLRLAALPRPRARAAAILLVEAAVGETISMALFRAGRRAAREPLTRAALGAIVADEVRHQRNGWAGLEALWASLSGPEKEALQAETTDCFAASEQRIAVPALRRLEAGEPFDPTFAELGVLAPEARVEAFYGAVERLVVPRLDALGLDGTRA